MGHRLPVPKQVFTIGLGFMKILRKTPISAVGATPAVNANPSQDSLRGQHNHAAGVDICFRRANSK